MNGNSKNWQASPTNMPFLHTKKADHSEKKNKARVAR